MTQPTYSLGSEPPTTHLKNGKGRNTHCRQRLQTIGNTGLLSNSLSIKVFKFFYAFDIAIKQINFFEKKQTNYLPHLIVGIFLALLLLLAGYLTVSYNVYVSQARSNREWLVQEAEAIRVSRQMEEYDRLTDQLTANYPQFQALQIPIAQVASDLIAQLPDDNQGITTFALDGVKQATIVLEDVAVDDVSTTITRLQALDFVTNTNFIRLDRAEESAFGAEVSVELNEEQLKSEVQP